MAFSWRDLPPEQMERHFNPRFANPDAQRHIERFALRSARARLAIPGRYDLRYGKGEKQTLDLHIPRSGVSTAPLVIFIHGGFWRGLDKDEHSFVVPPMLDTGAIVANVNYDLCPHVSLDVIVEEIAQALDYCHLNGAGWGANPSKLYLVGHSAGAHLAAQMLLRTWPPEQMGGDAIRGVAAITGVYEPEVILGISVNQEAQIAAPTASRYNCLGRTFTSTPSMLVAAGGDEPEGWIGQSEDFVTACIGAKLRTQMLIAPGANHFTILERAVSTDDPLCTAMFDLWRRQ